MIYVQYTLSKAIPRTHLTCRRMPHVTPLATPNSILTPLTQHLEKVPVIVCLTKLSEGEVQKAHKYWPDEGQTTQFGKLYVRNSGSGMVS